MPGNTNFGRVNALGDRVEYTDQWQVMRGQSGQLNRQIEIQDHFCGAAVHPALWLNNKDGSGVTFALVAGQQGGVARLDTGATSGSRDSFVADVNWKTSLGGLALEARVTASSLAACRFNVGFTDATTDGGAGKVVFEVAGAAVTANAAANAVCAVFDAAATNPNWLLVGRKASVNTAAVDSGAALTAATFDVVRLTVNPDGHAVLQINDKTIVAVSNAVTATTLLTPYIGIVNTGAASKKLDSDYVYVKCANAAGV